MQKILIMSLLLGTFVVKAQTTPTPPLTPANPAPTRELKWNLNDDGSQYFKITFLNQTWLRYNQSNDGTMVVGKPASETFDIGLRRTRIQMFGQIAPRTFLYFQFGQNNFNYLSGYPNGNRKLQAFFHDALGEYQVFKNKNYLKIGAGLTICNGLSRFSQPSIGTILTTDVPVFAQATVDQTDEFSRKLNLYARGQVGKIDYRVSLSDPFPITSNGQITTAPPSKYSSFAQKGHHKQLQGYVAYQFFDHEPHTTPYMTGTYLGKKKVLNIGAGIISQKDAMWTMQSNGDTAYQAMTLWALEAFYDAPLNAEKGTAISAYLGYFNCDYGSNYLRYNGIMNPASGTTRPIVGASGAVHGNAVPMFGTGSVVYGQVGYLLPQSLLGEKGQLQPYLAATYANYERLEKPATTVDLGINWLISGHNSKLSINYQNRPTYRLGTDNAVEADNRKGCVVVQYQVFI